MPQKDLKVRVSAEIGAFLKDMDRVSAKAKETAKKTEDVGKQSQSGIGRITDIATQHEKAWGQVANTMVGAGTAITGGLALSAKAAMDWESAWTGVTKTVDGTPEQLAQIEGGLRDLAKELPSTHAEIAGVAEAAGQLGVAREDILGFTKTMIDLGESTNLTAEDAATNIAQISNVMGTMEREGSKGVERFGATLVALGNDGASTEAEILNMAQRIAGAGASLNASEADVLALSNTLASMGVRAELGGGVATRVLLKMRTAVDEGGESIEAFAGVAGTSAEEFATKFSESPMEALQMVAEGIDRTNDAGGNLTATLKDLGIKGTEEMQVMLALANSGDLLTESLETGSKAWEENTALVEEANKRYETAESKVKMAWNNIKDAGIDAGAALLPVIAGMADAVADLAGWFGDLPGPVKTTITVLGSVSGVGLLAAGGFMKIVGALGDTITKMQALGLATPRTTRAISGFGKVLGGVTVVGAGILAGKVAIEAINDAVRSGKPDVEAYFNLIATGSSLSDSLDFNPGTDFTGLNQLKTLRTEADVTKAAIEQLATMNDALLGRWWAENITLGDTREQVDRALALETALQAVSRAFDMGQAELGIQQLSDFAEQANLTDQEVAQMINNVPELKSALMSLATEGGIKIDPNDELGLVDIALGRIKSSAPGAAEGMAGLEGALGGTATSAEDASSAMDDFLDKLYESGALVRDEREAYRHYQESIDAVTASITENGKTLDVNTEKGRANQAAFDGLAESGEGYVKALAAGGATEEELQNAMTSTYESLIVAAEQFGITGDKADKMAREVMGIPDDVKVESWMSEAAKKTAEETKASIEQIPKRHDVKIVQTFETHGSPYAPMNPIVKQRQASSPNNGSIAKRFGGLASGGKLPYTGLGTDMILGIDSAGMPRTRVDDGEWIIREQSATKYNGVLAAINADAPGVQGLAGYAGGGRAGGREFSGGLSTSSSTVNNGPTINMPITINGATDENRVAQRVKDDISWKFRQAGMNLGF